MRASAIDRGTVIAGGYVLIEPLSEVDERVYRATHEATQRSVVVRLWRAESQAALSRVLETLKTAQRIRHPALAAVEAFGMQSDDTVFVVSELVQGEPLDVWADKVGIPPLPTVVELLHRVYVGLNATHRNGLAHDALNPRNVFVVQTEGGSVPRFEAKLLDLGVLACMRSWPPRPLAAQFMAPEQLVRARRANEAALGADAAMNVFSCGALLYYLCTGGAPFQGRNLEEISLAHAAGKLVPPSKINPQISPALDELVLRALSFAPIARFGSVSELASALMRVRPSRNASGVRQLGVDTPSFGLASRRRDRRTTWDAHFEDSPTSETRLPLSPITERPPAVDETVITPPPTQRSSVPAGSFSGRLPTAPPARPSITLPPPPVPRARRSVPDFATQIPITALLAPPPPTESFEVSVFDSDEPAIAVVTPRRAAQRMRSMAIVAGCLALTASAAGAFLALRSPVEPAVDARVAPVRARPLAGDRSRSATEAAPLPVPIAVRVAPRPVPSAVTMAREAIAPPPPEEIDAVVQTDAPLEEAQPTRAPRWRAWANSRIDRARTATVSHAQINPVLSIQAQNEDLDGESIEITRSDDGSDPAPSTFELAPAPRALRPAVVRTVSTTTPAPAPKIDRPRSSGRLAATPQIQDLVVRGSLASSEVRRAIDRIKPQLAACYAQAARAAGNNAFGAVSIDVEIDERGRVDAPRARGSALAGLDRCVAQATAKLAGRPPDTGTVKASWKVVFEP